MTLDPAFEVRLKVYRIDSQTISLRSEIWSVLDPHLDAILEAYLTNVFNAVPFYRAQLNEHASVHKQQVRRHIEQLLKNPFDEAWIDNAQKRAIEERNAGLDMRTRCAFYGYVIPELTRLVSRLWWWRPLKAFRLLDAASRIFMLDTANAMACHNALDAQRSAERSDLLAGAIQEFAQEVDKVRHAVANATGSLGTASQDLAGMSSSALQQVGAAAKAANDTTAKVQNIAKAAENLEIAIAQISKESTSGAEQAQVAVRHSDQMDTNIQRLSQSVDRISSVVDLIAGIAAQTNLLALNATIEAARAGQAGKGFAVVATEVKSLALQTERATADVKCQIEMIQKAMQDSIAEIAAGKAAISETSGKAAAVAQSVAPGAVATTEIATSAKSAVDNAITVSMALDLMQDSVRHVEQVTNLVLDCSSDLTRRSGEMENAMRKLFDAAAKKAGVRKFTDLSRNAAR